MDETEARIAALELLTIEIIPWLDTGVVDDAERSIRAGLDGSSEDERMVRLQALQLIEDGRKRYAPPASGFVIKP
jgi:hypothetical protein